MSFNLRMDFYRAPYYHNHERFHCRLVLLAKINSKHRRPLEIGASVGAPRMTALNSGTQSTNCYIELPNLHFPSSFNLDSLPQSFATFFLRQKFTNFDLQFYLAPPLLHHICLQLPNLLSYPFSILQTIAEVSALLSSSPDTSCDLDPIPTSLLKQCKSVLLPTITNIINLAMSTRVFPDQFKNCSVHPLLKNPTLTKKTYPTTGQYLTYLTYPNSQNDLLKTDLLIISMKTTS